MKNSQKPADPMAAVDAAILRLQQLENWALNLRATAPAFVAEFGDLNQR